MTAQTDTDSAIAAAFDARVQRRTERRDFFRTAMGAMAVTAGVSALTMAGSAEAQTTTYADADILNFALNLEYLEAQFYAYATGGAGIAANLLTGAGTQGAANFSGARAVTFTDSVLARYAREIAADELAHVTYLRTALGSAAVAQPALDLSVSPTSAFSAAALAAKLINSGDSFNPYASEDAFLLAAYLFEDVGVTAYKGAAPLLSDVAIVDAAAGLLADEAFHAGLIRTALDRRGVDVDDLREKADKISDARDDLDGDDESDGPPRRVDDDDQGISPVTSIYGRAANVVPTDGRGLVFGRTVEQVHNIAYLTKQQVSAGGFFPAGTNNANAALRRSGAN